LAGDHVDLRQLRATEPEAIVRAAARRLRRPLLEGDDRLKLFERAFAKYPREVPFNVILMPMEGDPNAPSAFWLAARTTGGSFLSPSKDWP
jgi:hypothetical protein